jgi:hypothetical protein
MARLYTHISTNSKRSEGTVLVLGRHYSSRAAASTGHRVVELTYDRGNNNTRSPVVGERLGLYHEPNGAEYALAPIVAGRTFAPNVLR